MTYQEKQEAAFNMIRAKGYTVKVCSQEEDFAGVDCIVGKRKVDVKGETTLQKYPETLLLSLGHSKDNTHYTLPKYLQRNDVDVWVCDITGGNDIFVITPEMLDKYRSSTNYDILKKPEMDYFNRWHKLAVIKKSDCIRLRRKGENK